jgi:hypothetical protein
MKFMMLTQDPKHKVHKPVKATLRLEIERLYNDDNEQDILFECGSFGNGSIDADARSGGGASLSGRSNQGLGFTKGMYNGRQKWSPVGSSRKHHNSNSGSGSSIDLGRSDVCGNVSSITASATLSCSGS